MDLGLTGRTFILTGASGGLGFATAQQLVADGANVVISSRSRESVDRAVAELGPRAIGVAVDNADATPRQAGIDAENAHQNGQPSVMLFSLAPIALEPRRTRRSSNICSARHRNLRARR